MAVNLGKEGVRPGQINNAVVIDDWRADIPGALSANKFAWNFPTLTRINRRGAEISWKIFVSLVDAKVFNKDGTIVFKPILDSYFDGKCPHYGYIKVDAMQKSTGVIRESNATIVAEGKNIGRKNETNTFQQALRDANSRYQKQARKFKTPTADTTSIAAAASAAASAIELIPPMLAKNITDIGGVDALNQMKVDVYIQPKLNGIRAVAVFDPIAGECVLYGRNGLKFSGFESLKNCLRAPLEAEFAKDGTIIYIDGELYKHGVSLQQLSGNVRRLEGKEAADMGIILNVFDCFAAPKTPLSRLIFSDRFNLVRRLILDTHCDERVIRVVETQQIAGENLTDGKSVSERAREFFRKVLADKYEGAIVRPDVDYEYGVGGYHSTKLLKMKPIMDAEFEVIGFTEGEHGKAVGAILFNCKTPEGNEFTVTPAMTLEERKRLFNKYSKEKTGKEAFSEEYFGKKLVVYFDEWSNDKVPLRARTEGLIRVDDLVMDPRF
ncbi:MAG: hypothetical protein M0R33_13890 [Methylomonas sp.]|uniref:ATP-dependent DNA ligase n=1 Tax=Methylomonas sp. TaxID=418 RepID=UPI0025FF9A6B|nr:hypothetical protein [Methylomonas sp.]MCK9607527.1 hypothetical protein [Methylomonas sp.]